MIHSIRKPSRRLHEPLIHPIRFRPACILSGSFLGFALLLAGPIGAQERTEFSPGIDGITVYPDRALITRSTVVELDAGKHILVFDDASPNLDPASLRGFCDDTAVVVQGISSYVERRSQTSNVKVRELESKLKDLEKQRAREQARINRAKRDLASIAQYADYLAKTVSDQSVRTKGDPQRWDESLQFLSARRFQAKQNEQAASERFARLSEEISLVNENLERIRAESEKSTRIVEITLQAPAKKKLRIGFSYIMSRASWGVSYGLYNQADGTILVEYYGNVRQQTGEDWSNVDVRLSTSVPSHGAERSKITPLYVGAREARTKEGYQQTEQAAAGETEPSEPTPVTADTGGFSSVDDTGRSLVFQIPRKANVPSTDRSHRMTIARFSLTPKETFYRLVAGVQRAAHLTIRLANDRPFPLLAGPADSYRSSGFVGRTEIRYTPSGATFLAGFGVDRSIRVFRDVRTYTEKAGAFSSNKIFRTTVELSIANEGSSSREVQILERIPVSDVDSVKIRIRPETTAGFREEKERSGILRWILPMKPGERRVVILSFEAEVPSDFPGTLFGR